MTNNRAGLIGAFLIINLFGLSISYATNKNIDLHVQYKTVHFAGKSIQAISVNNQIPAPTLRFTEGDHITLNVHNHLDIGTAIHWHGILLPWQMDGVEGVTQKAIPPGGLFKYQFTLKQSGTYWYHAHAGLQEQQGLYGAFVIDPKTPPAYHYTKDYTIVLSDWINEHPNKVLANLKKEGDYYSPNFPLQPSLSKFIKDYKKATCVQRQKLISDYKMMQKMRMSIYDLADVAYDAFLLNGQTRCAPWQGSVSVGDIVRLRFVGAGASTIYRVKIPGEALQMVHVQGNDIRPYFVKDFTVAPGETYDVLVKITDNKPYLIYAESADTLGAAVGALVPTTLGPNPALPFEAIAPFPEPSPVMMGMDHGAMDMGPDTMKMDHGSMDMSKPSPKPKPKQASLTMGTKYQNLQSDIVTNNPDKPVQEIKMALSGFMGKYIWFINGVPEYLAKPIIIHPDIRYRLVFTNASMMHHPMHLHGHWLILRNGHGAHDPLLHTIEVPPGATAVADFDANAGSGQWFFHCHHLYHMMSGMTRVFRYPGFNDPHLLMAHPPGAYRTSFIDFGADLARHKQSLSFEFLLGGDYHKIQLLTEDAELKNGKIEKADLDVFYWRSISEFWAIKGGFNYVDQPDLISYVQPGIGFEGLMPYFINTDVRAYYHSKSVKLDVDLSRDTQLCNNLFIRTGLRSILATKTVIQDQVGSGLNQLRYTLRPYYRLAPGVNIFAELEYNKDYGALKQIRINNLESTSETTLTVGLSVLL